ncbi:uncharacterized protein LOC128861034 isoform X3 [Anastrepha ludens]|uniref:uncharacterized protein LOC128861034 isoform X3 n=1 Tax=Anastrepha ludens TaxID=28586 RepID=UPI0023B139E1|nr:uncharacterized protein LOC128861034 isoform X3 [Anastrepha ludens]
MIEKVFSNSGYPSGGDAKPRSVFLPRASHKKSPAVRRRLTAANSSKAKYGAEAWTVTTSDEASLECLRERFYRRSFEPLHVSDGEYRRRWNNELYEFSTA